MSGGLTAIPAGATLSGTVTEAERAAALAAARPLVAGGPRRRPGRRTGARSYRRAHALGVSAIEAEYGGTRLGRQELEGELIADNQQAMITQNMLTKGQTREEAETEVGVLQQLISLVQGLTLQLRPDTAANRLQLELDLQLTPAIAEAGQSVREESDRGN